MHHALLSHVFQLPTLENQLSTNAVYVAYLRFCKTQQSSIIMWACFSAINFTVLHVYFGDFLSWKTQCVLLVRSMANLFILFKTSTYLYLIGIGHCFVAEFRQPISFALIMPRRRNLKIFLLSCVLGIGSEIGIGIGIDSYTAVVVFLESAMCFLLS